jgi:spore germination protein PC
MDYLHHLYCYVQQLASHIQRQDAKVNHLEQSIRKLQNQLKELEENPMTNIERIEYKFDQLKIETLEGTLNIGLNPAQPENIEDFSVNTSVPGSINPQLAPLQRNISADLVEEIHSQIKKELEEKGPDIINGVLEERQMRIAEPYYDFIIEDIKKQLEQRIVFYLQQLDSQSFDLNRDEVTAQVISTLHEEVKKGIHAFLTYLPDSLKKGDS